MQSHMQTQLHIEKHSKTNNTRRKPLHLRRKRHLGRERHHLPRLMLCRKRTTLQFQPCRCLLLTLPKTQKLGEDCARGGAFFPAWVGASWRMPINCCSLTLL